MKKGLAIFMSITVAASLSTAVFANTGIKNGGTDTAEVKGTYNKKDTDIVYSVDISWSDLKFTYNDAYKGEWNPKTHSYDNATEAGWDKSSGIITVTNHSNTEIKATPTYTAKEGFEDVGMTFDTKKLTVATADNGVNGNAGKAVEKTITVTPNGRLPENTSDAVIGTITINIE